MIRVYKKEFCEKHPFFGRIYHDIYYDFEKFEGIIWPLEKFNFNLYDLLKKFLLSSHKCTQDFYDVFLYEKCKERKEGHHFTMEFLASWRKWLHTSLEIRLVNEILDNEERFREGLKFLLKCKKIIAQLKRMDKTQTYSFDSDKMYLYHKDIVHFCEKMLGVNSDPRKLIKWLKIETRKIQELNDLTAYKEEVSLIKDQISPDKVSLSYLLEFLMKDYLSDQKRYIERMQEIKSQTMNLMTTEEECEHNFITLNESHDSYNLFRSRKDSSAYNYYDTRNGLYDSSFKQFDKLFTNYPMKNFNSKTSPQRMNYKTNQQDETKFSNTKQDVIYYESSYTKKDKKTCVKCEVDKHYNTTEEKIKSRDTSKNNHPKESFDETVINKQNDAITGEATTRRKESQNYKDRCEVERVPLGAGMNLTTSKSPFNKRARSNIYANQKTPYKNTSKNDSQQTQSPVKTSNQEYYDSYLYNNDLFDGEMTFRSKSRGGTSIGSAESLIPKIQYVKQILAMRKSAKHKKNALVKCLGLFRIVDPSMNKVKNKILDVRNLIGYVSSSFLSRPAQREMVMNAGYDPENFDKNWNLLKQSGYKDILAGLEKNKMNLGDYFKTFGIPYINRLDKVNHHYEKLVNIDNLLFKKKIFGSPDKRSNFRDSAKQSQPYLYSLDRGIFNRKVSKDKKSMSNASPDKRVPLNLPKFDVDDEANVYSQNTVRETDSGSDFIEMSNIDGFGKESKDRLKNELVAKTAKNYDTNELNDEDWVSSHYGSTKDYVKRMEMHHEENSFFDRKEMSKQCSAKLLPDLSIEEPENNKFKLSTESIEPEWEELLKVIQNEDVFHCGFNNKSYIALYRDNIMTFLEHNTVENNKELAFTVPQYKKLLCGYATPIVMHDKSIKSEIDFNPTAWISNDGNKIQFSNDNKFDLVKVPKEGKPEVVVEPVSPTLKENMYTSNSSLNPMKITAEKDVGADLTPIIETSNKEIFTDIKEVFDKSFITDEKEKDDKEMMTNTNDVSNIEIQTDVLPSPERDDKICNTDEVVITNQQTDTDFVNDHMVTFEDYREYVPPVIHTSEMILITDPVLFAEDIIPAEKTDAEMNTSVIEEPKIETIDMAVGTVHEHQEKGNNTDAPKEIIKSQLRVKTDVIEEEPKVETSDFNMNTEIVERKDFVLNTDPVVEIKKEVSDAENTTDPTVRFELVLGTDPIIEKEPPKKSEFNIQTDPEKVTEKKNFEMNTDLTSVADFEMETDPIPDNKPETTDAQVNTEVQAHNNQIVRTDSIPEISTRHFATMSDPTYTKDFNGNTDEKHFKHVESETDPIIEDKPITTHAATNTETIYIHNLVVNTDYVPEIQKATLNMKTDPDQSTFKQDQEIMARELPEQFNQYFKTKDQATAALTRSSALQDSNGEPVDSVLKNGDIFVSKFDNKEYVVRFDNDGDIRVMSFVETNPVDGSEKIMLETHSVFEIMNGYKVQISMMDDDICNDEGFKQTAWVSLDGNIIHLSESEKYNMVRKQQPSKQDNEKMQLLMAEAQKKGYAQATVKYQDEMFKMDAQFKTSMLVSQGEACIQTDPPILVDRNIATDEKPCKGQGTVLDEQFELGAIRTRLAELDPDGESVVFKKKHSTIVLGGSNGETKKPSFTNMKGQKVGQQSTTSFAGEESNEKSPMKKKKPIASPFKKQPSIVEENHTDAGFKKKLAPKQSTSQIE